MSNIDNPQAVIDLTRTLIKIPSENPTGDEVALGRYVADWLRDHAIETELLPVEGERANVLGRVRGGDGPPLILIAHLDTVPIGDRAKWRHDPFGAEIADGFIYGRGSADMKSGLAAAMITLARIQQSGLKLAGDLILAGTIDEEEAFMKGSHALARAGLVPSNAYLLTMEPTGCQINTAQKGGYWFEITMRGRGAHAANPEIGADANRAMAEAILGWYAAADELAERQGAPHPLLGRPTLVVSRLEGGVKTNIVSEICRAEIDMRLPPPFGKAEAQELVERVAERAGAKYGVQAQVRPQNGDRPPVECQPDSPMLAALDRAYQEVTGQLPIYQGFVGYTDAAMLAALTHNQQAVVFGPGDLKDAHTTDERVEISQIITATGILERTARYLLGQEK